MNILEMEGGDSERLFTSCSSLYSNDFPNLLGVSSLSVLYRGERKSKPVSIIMDFRERGALNSNQRRLVLLKLLTIIKLEVNAGGEALCEGPTCSRPWPSPNCLGLPEAASDFWLLDLHLAAKWTRWVQPSALCLCCSFLTASEMEAGMEGHQWEGKGGVAVDQGG